MAKSAIQIMLVFVAGLSVQAVAAAPSQPVVGTVGTAIANPTARQIGQSPRVLRPGADIMFKDRISTKRGSSTQIAFADRSTLSIGENSDVVIDSFVYHPNADGTMRVKLAKGLLHFVGGEISHEGGTNIVTPTVTIGIRGGIGTIASLDDVAALREVPGIPTTFKGGTIVMSGYGTLTVRNSVSEQIINQPGFAVFVGSNLAPIKPPIQIDPAMLEGVLAHIARQPHAAPSGPVLRVPTMERAPRPMRSAMRAQGVNALDFISVFSVGNSFARNRSQSRMATDLQTQIAATIVPRPQTSPFGVSASATPASDANTTQNVATQQIPNSPAQQSAGGRGAPVSARTPSAAPSMTLSAIPPAAPATPAAPAANAAAPSTTLSSVVSALTSLTGQIAVHDLTAATITAHVIYAHDIHASNIQAGQIIYGGGYGNGNGNKNTNTISLQLNEIDAHDISANTITADIVYAHSVSP